MKKEDKKNGKNFTDFGTTKWIVSSKINFRNLEPKINLIIAKKTIKKTWNTEEELKVKKGENFTEEKIKENNFRV